MNKRTSEALAQFEIQRAEKERKGLATYDFGLASQAQANQKSGGRAYDPTLPSEGSYENPKSGKKAIGSKSVPQPEQAKLSRREKKRRKARKVQEKLRKEMRKGLLSTPSSTSADRKLSSSSAFSNVFTSTSIYQGGSPGGGKRR